jgi:hypothetical protein
MALTYEIDTQRKIILVAAAGQLTAQDLVELHHRFAADPAVRPEFSILFDLREAHGEQFSAESVRELANLPLLLSQTSRRAVVVRDDLGYGIARMYGLRREDRVVSYEVFRDLDEARRWVEVDGGG